MLRGVGKQVSKKTGVEKGHTPACVTVMVLPETVTS